MTAATANYVATLNAARGAARTARAALAAAVLHSTQVLTDADRAHIAGRSPEWAARLVEMDAEVARIAATVPALRTASEQADAAFAALEVHACHRCSGTGDYQGPTSHFQQGRPVCFTCKGTGRRK